LRGVVPLRTLAVVVAVLAAAPAAASAAPATAATAAQPRDLRVAGGSTNLTLDADTAATLAAAGIGVDPVGRTRSILNGLALPVTYGRLTAQALTGTLRHNGGLRLTNGGRSLDLNNVRLNLDGSPDLTAQVGSGKRISIADVDLSDAQLAVTSRSFSVTDAVVRLNAAGASAIDAALETDAFAARMVLGSAAVETRIRRR
jgi:hypothetical protein